MGSRISADDAFIPPILSIHVTEAFPLRSSARLCSEEVLALLCVSAPLREISVFRPPVPLSLCRIVPPSPCPCHYPNPHVEYNLEQIDGVTIGNIPASAPHRVSPHRLALVGNARRRVPPPPGRHPASVQNARCPVNLSFGRTGPGGRQIWVMTSPLSPGASRTAPTSRRNRIPVPPPALVLHCPEAS